MLEIVEREVADIQIPKRAVNIVLMQPFAEVDGGNEPYKWKPAAVANQIKAIQRTVEISNGPIGEKKTHAHFTLFPEYSIPGIDGVKELDKAVRNADCRNGRIILGCVDGLTKEEVGSLEAKHSVNIDTKVLDGLHDHEWVNCAITWVKDLQGNTQAWLQSKLCPARLEKGTECKTMLRGDAVYLFTTKFDDNTNCRFLTMICIDWIGGNASGEGILGVLDSVNKKWKGDGHTDPKQLSFVFVPQFNEKPSDDEFLEKTKHFFSKTEYPLIERSKCIVVMGNVSEGKEIGKHQSYGCSALVSHPDSGYDRKCCQPSFALSSVAFDRKGLGRCVDARLREMGPCIHTVSVRVPGSFSTSPGDRTYPIESAWVFPISENQKDPRVPSGPVPAIVKWTNDQLDVIEPILTADPKHGLYTDIKLAHSDIVERLRWFDARDLRRLITPLASATIESKANGRKWISLSENKKLPNIDLWEAEELECLKTVVHVLSIINVARSLEIILNAVHASVTFPDGTFDIIVVTGGKTHEDCFNHSQASTRVREHGYLLVVTKDEHNRHYALKYGKFTTPKPIANPKGPKITDPSSRVFRLGFQDLDHILQGSNTSDELLDNVRHELGL